MSGPMNVTDAAQRRFAWLIIVLLFAGSVLNYVDRAVLGVLMPQVRRDLSLSYSDYGLAVNSFLVMYTIFYVLGGRMADRLGYRRSYTLTLVFWSLASMLHALTRGLASLCLFRGLLGIGEGGYYPAAMRGAADWFPPENRAKAVGVLLCGISIGTLLTPPFVAWLTALYGWRSAFLAIGALGLLLIPPWLVLQRRIARAYGTPDPAPASRTAAEDSDGDDPSIADVLARRKYWCILTARALTDSAWYFYLFWMPGYFQEARQFDLRMVGALLWIPYFGANLGALGGAWASSGLIARGWSLDRARKSILIPSAALCTLGALTGFVPSGYAALALVSLALLGHQSWSSNIHTVITEITPPKHVAMLYGITGAAGTLMGALTQPAIGRVVDALGYEPAFVAAGSAYAAAIALLLAAGKIERIRRETPSEVPA
jgi:MFS transporter, ACS family, hexuronate transporter